MLTLNNVEVIYDKVFLAIKGVSIEVAGGGMVALLGSNGAGKSTTLKSISGLLVPERGEVTRGSVQWAGRDIGQLPAPGARPPRYRACIGRTPRVRTPHCRRKPHRGGVHA